MTTIFDPIWSAVATAYTSKLKAQRREAVRRGRERRRRIGTGCAPSMITSIAIAARRARKDRCGPWPDTRDLTGILMGDPVFQRSALYEYRMQGRG